MLKNEDISVVVLDAEMFSRLVGLAEVGAFEMGRDGDERLKAILRHARRFNTSLSQARAVEIKSQRASYRQDRARVRVLIQQPRLWLKQATDKFVPFRPSGVGRLDRCAIRGELFEDRLNLRGISESGAHVSRIWTDAEVPAGLHPISDNTNYWWREYGCWTPRR